MSDRNVFLENLNLFCGSLGTKSFEDHSELYHFSHNYSPHQLIM